MRHYTTKSQDFKPHGGQFSKVSTISPLLTLIPYTKGMKQRPMTQTIPIEHLPWTEAKTYKLVVELVRYLQDDYDSEPYDNSGRYRFEIENGRKYYKITNGPAGGVHAFVDKKTAEVYKPSSHKSPAKGVRYDLRIIEDRERCFSNADWSGGYLYLR